MMTDCPTATVSDSHSRGGPLVQNACCHTAHGLLPAEPSHGGRAATRSVTMVTLRALLMACVAPRLSCLARCVSVWCMTHSRWQRLMTETNLLGLSHAKQPS